ncbi:MAG: DegT/DnrJ/EryC1/StrS family aminotransferase [Jejuia sp.]
MLKKIHLSSSKINHKEILFIEEAINRKEFSNYGTNLDAFQFQLKEYFAEKREIALLNSGTSAIHLALINLGVKRDEEVICQSFTFAASAFPILYQGAKPVFIDSEKDTWNICPNYLEDAIKARLKKGIKPKAIIIVHSYGMPAKMDDIIAISNKYRIPIIEDAAESLGSIYKGVRCGAFGDFGILSFNGNKIITTSGGGALLCKTKSQMEKSIFLSNQAKNKSSFYEHTEIGYNYAMSNIAAGIGRSQMEVLDRNINIRREIHEFYLRLFKDLEGVELLSEPNVNIYSNYWLNCALINESITGFSRDDLIKALEKENIESRPLWRPMHMQPLFKNSLFYGTGVSESLFNSGICFPSGSDLSNDDLNRIQTAIEKCIKS